MTKITKHYSQTLYLFTVYGFFVLVLLGIFFIFTYFEYKKNVLYDAKRGLENMCASISDSLDTQLDHLSAISLNIVYSNLIKSNFQDFTDTYQKAENPAQDDPSGSMNHILDSRKNAETIHNVVTAMIGAYQTASEIRLYTMDGYYVESGYWLSTSRTDLRSLSWYQDVMALNGYKYFSIPHTRRDLPAAGKNLNAHKFLSLIRMFLNKDRSPDGIVEVVQDCGKIFSLASQMEDSNLGIQVTVYNDRKEVVYPYLNPLSAEPYASIIEANGIGDGMTQFAVNQAQKPVLVSRRTLTNYDWEIVLVQTEASIYKPLETYQQLFIRITVLSIMLTLLICFYISKRFTIPLQKLTRATEKITIDRVLDEKKVNLTSADSNIKELSILCESVRTMYDKLRSTSREILLLRNEETRAKLQATQSLINPHFLYNSLTNISVMAEEQMNDDIVRMCQALCIYFRYISSSGEMMVTLEKELRHTQSYLTCMQMRYTEELEYTLSIPPDAKEILIPKLIAQPLVENAFKYAFVKCPPWNLSITAWVKDGFWYLCIKDNAGTMTDEKKEEILSLYEHLDLDEELKSMKIGGMGLKNVYLRLKLLYGDDAVFQIENEPGRKTSVILGGSICIKKGMNLI